MMTDPTDLIHAILADPADPGPRLAYSDWLEETGDLDRAEAVRLEVRIRALRGPFGDRRSMEIGALEARRNRLDQTHAERWVADLPVVPQITYGEYRKTTGGLVDQIGVDDAAVFREHSAAMLAVHPITWFAPPNVTEITAAILSAPGMERLGGLTFHYGPDQAQAVAEAHHLVGLRSLTLMFNGADIGCLARASHLASLVELDLSIPRVAPVGMDQLGRSHSLRGLRRLILQGAALPGEPAARLASAHFERLETLRLVGCDLDPAAAKLLADSPMMANLRHLDLTENNLGADGVAAIVGSPGAVGFETLDLTSTAPGLKGIAALVRADRCAAIRSLRLYSAGLVATDVIKLAGAPWMPGLTRLAIGQNEVHPAGIRAIAMRARSLEVLDAWGTSIGDLGAKALADSDALGQLRELDLSYNAIGPAGAEALAGSATLTGLVGLNLRANPLGSTGVAALARSSHFDQLVALDLQGTGVGEAGVRALIEPGALPNLRWLNLSFNEGIGRSVARALVESDLAARLDYLSLFECKLAGATLRWALRKLGNRLEC